MPKFHDYDLWVVLDSHTSLKINAKKSQILYPGEGVIFQPGDTVRATHDPDKPLTAFSVHFKFRYAKSASILNFKNSLPSRVRTFDAEFLRVWVRRIVSNANDSPTLLTEKMTETLITWMISESTHKQSQHFDPKITALISSIREDPGRIWESHAMARSSGLSLSQFNRSFRKMVGMSPAQFIIKQRTSRAEQLLQESDLSLQEIADALGYKDIYFFHRQFKQITGRTPGEIRKKTNRLLKI
ncbi:MAG: AraC family transcriptional regulator [Chthoniobacterales bacterium]